MAVEVAEAAVVDLAVVDVEDPLDAKMLIVSDFFLLLNNNELEKLHILYLFNTQLSSEEYFIELAREGLNVKQVNYEDKCFIS